MSKDELIAKVKEFSDELTHAFDVYKDWRFERGFDSPFIKTCAGDTCFFILNR